jgi:integrase
MARFTFRARAGMATRRNLRQKKAVHRFRIAPFAGLPARSSKRTPLMMNNLLGRQILPSLNRCETCRKAEADHAREEHEYKRDASLSEWHGWHAARRGLGTNLNRLGVDDSVIQRILRHSNIATTQTFYIKAVAPDVRDAMTKLEKSIPKSQLDTNWTPDPASTKPN